MTRALLLLAALLATGLPVHAEPGVVQLDAAGRRVTAELAVTPREQALGLMHRQALAADHGMLFVYPKPERRCMWMKDTLIPLSVAFLDEQGAIINIAEMQPRSLQSHCAERPARFALEMPGLWFARHGIAPGTRIAGTERAAAVP